MKANKSLFYFFLGQIFLSLIAWVPVFIVIQKKIGFNLNEIMLIQSLYYALGIILELPTGYIGDYFGKKKAMLFSAFFMILANFIFMIKDNFNWTLIHFLIVGFSRALNSGNSSAYLYELLNKNTLSSKYQEIESKLRITSLIFKILSYFLSGYLILYWIKLPYFITFIFSILALICFFKIEELNQTQKTKQKINLKKIERKFYIFLISGVLLGVTVRLTEINLFQPFLISLNIQEKYFGFIFALLLTMEAFGNYLNKYLKSISNIKLLNISLLFITLSILLLSLNFSFFMTIFIFIIYSFFSGIAFSNQKLLINQNITDHHYRAFYLSLDAWITRIVSSLAAWYISNQIINIEIHNLFFQIGFMMTLVIIFYWILIGKLKTYS